MIHKDFIPVQIFDLDIEALRISFQILKAKTRTITGTLLDYASDNEIKNLKKEKKYNLGIYEPTPKLVINHIKFTTKVLHTLLKKYPDDQYLSSLKTEPMFNERVSTNCYERYGIKYNIKSVN